VHNSYTRAYMANGNPNGVKGPASSSVTPAGVPLDVTDLRVSDVGDTTVTLAFTPPSDNGSPITGYLVSVNGASQALPANNVVGGLTDGQSYAFQVVGCNNSPSGTNECADFAKANSTPGVTPYGVPGAPSVSANVNGLTITWTWSAPPDNGSAITSYSAALDGSAVGVGCCSFSRTFGPDEPHNLQVVAHNARGASAPSSAPPARTPYPSISVGKGAHVTVTGCTGAPCAWITTSVSGLVPNRGYTLGCYDDHPDNPNVPFRTYRITTDGSGRYSESSGYCVYGYPGDHVFIQFDSFRSSAFLWY
jgi:hypothetical protein